MDTLYLAQKDGQQFYIQSHQIAMYSEMGYTIYKMAPEIVTDIAAENTESGTTTGSTV